MALVKVIKYKNRDNIMFDFIPWKSMGIAALETFLIFWITIIVLRFVSARVFSQTSPEYLLFLLLLASGMYSGIAGKNPSVWNSFAIGATLLITVVLLNKFHFLKKFITGNPIILMSNGQLNDKEMHRTLIEVDDLNKMAREYGFSSYETFDTIILEKNGQLTGIINLNENEKLRIRKK